MIYRKLSKVMAFIMAMVVMIASLSAFAYVYNESEERTDCGCSGTCASLCESNDCCNGSCQGCNLCDVECHGCDPGELDCGCLRFCDCTRVCDCTTECNCEPDTECDCGLPSDCVCDTPPPIKPDDNDTSSDTEDKTRTVSPRTGDSRLFSIPLYVLTSMGAFSATLLLLRKNRKEKFV